MTIVRLALHLEHFLQSADGRDAIALLQASGRHIVFCTHVERGQITSFQLDGNGFRKSVQPVQHAVECSTPFAPRPMMTDVTPIQIVEAVIRQKIGGRSPDELVPWLHRKLDEIADDAPM